MNDFLWVHIRDSEGLRPPSADEWEAAADNAGAALVGLSEAIALALLETEGMPSEGVA